MVNNSPPSKNPADSGTLVGLLRFALAKHLQHVDDMLPAQVVAYDAATNTAKVQPLISFVTTDNQLVSRAQVASVPVLQLSAGGYAMRFPISTGDLGWIKANDRDISVFKQTGQVAAPNTQRKHSFEDALFIPQAAWSALNISEDDAQNLVFQTYDGSVKIAITPTLIYMLAPEGVGIGGLPAFGALLDLQSTTRAFIPPRMTTGQRDAIPDPVEGMIVWNLDTHGLSSYNGSVWS